MSSEHKPVNKWTSDDIQQWLSDNNLQDCWATLLKHEITSGELLLKMDLEQIHALTAMLTLRHQILLKNLILRTQQNHTNRLNIILLDDSPSVPALSPIPRPTNIAHQPHNAQPPNQPLSTEAEDEQILNQMHAAKPRRHGHRYKKEEDRRILGYLRSNHSVEQIAATLERTPQSIKSRIQKLQSVASRPLLSSSRTNHNNMYNNNTNSSQNEETDESSGSSTEDEQDEEVQHTEQKESADSEKTKVVVRLKKILKYYSFEPMTARDQHEVNKVGKFIHKIENHNQWRRCLTEEQSLALDNVYDYFVRKYGRLKCIGNERFRLLEKQTDSGLDGEKAKVLGKRSGLQFENVSPVAKKRKIERDVIDLTQ